MKNKLFASLTLALLSTLSAELSALHAQGTAFTYQGRLNDGGVPANGVYDFRFRVFDALTDGTFFGGAVVVPAVGVSNGLFTIALAFNTAAFDGSARWLDIGVTTNGGAILDSLTPRQPVTATPYAMIAGNVTGAIPLAQLPASVVTNGASGVNISGTFNGNSAGATNVDLAFNSGGSIHVASGVFVLSSSPGVGANPDSVTAVDVNGDGKLDLVSANGTGNTLSVLTNNGSGGFVLSSTVITGTGPRSVAAADINGDGKVDLISASSSGNSLTLLTNNGVGGFVLLTSLALGSSPNCVIAVDVNSDDKMDLVSTIVGGVAVSTNNGIGGFLLSPSPGTGFNPYWVTSADVNGDGTPDLITANYSGNNLSVLTNNGSGGFAVASTQGVGTAPESVTAADVNGDGKVDLISANSGANSLSVLTNNGSGGFLTASTLSLGAGTQPISVTTADVNGDGKVDLISANFGTYTLSVLTNNGSGKFTLVSLPGVGTQPQSITAADVNGDGKVDLISANSGANTLSVLFNNTEFDGVFVGSGQFTTASFGASLGPKINLYSTTFGIGIQNSVLYTRIGAGGGFGWYAGGVHNDNTFDAGGGSVLMTLTAGGLVVNGTFVSASDRNLKQDFFDVNSRAVLEKVAQLPIQTWAYKNDPNTKHLGPMAQDFYAAFAIGPDDNHITTVDESGVALAAIQGLNQKLEAEVKSKDARIAELEQRLSAIETLLQK
jgi:hypothetical protein